MAQLVKNLSAMQETWVPSLGWEDPLEKGKATHSSILPWVTKSRTRLTDFHFQFSSVTQWCPTLCDPVNCSTQASLSITNSQSLLRFMSIESVMPSDHFILYHPLLLLPSIFPSIRAFPMIQLFASGGQSMRASASASVLPMNIQYSFPLG